MATCKTLMSKLVSLNLVGEEYRPFSESVIMLCSSGVLSCPSSTRCTPLPRPAHPRLTDPTSPHIPRVTHPRVSHPQPTLDELHPRAFWQVCVVVQQPRTTRCRPSTSPEAPDLQFFGNPRTNHTHSASQPTHIHKFTHLHHPTTPNTNSPQLRAEPRHSTPSSHPSRPRTAPWHTALIS